MTNDKPCSEVYWFPLVSEKFCDDLVAIMEENGGWSPGRNHNNDSRLKSGYEAVPTVDIHMKQIGWQEHWFHFLHFVVQSMQEKIY